MPAVSKKQKTFMDAVAHNPAFAKKVGVSKSVGKDFSKASKGMKFGSGPKTRVDRQTVNNPKTNQGKQELFNKGNTTMANKMNPGMKAIMAKKMGKPTMKKGIKKMADGGMPMVMKDGKKIPAFAADGKGKMAHGGMAHKMMHGGMTHKMAHGGGIETQGKTRGKMVNMKHGGKV